MSTANRRANPTDRLNIHISVIKRNESNVTINVPTRTQWDIDNSNTILSISSGALEMSHTKKKNCIPNIYQLCFGTYSPTSGALSKSHQNHFKRMKCAKQTEVFKCEQNKNSLIMKYAQIKTSACFNSTKPYIKVLIFEGFRWFFLFFFSAKKLCASRVMHFGVHSCIHKTYTTYAEG